MLSVWHWDCLGAVIWLVFIRLCVAGWVGVEGELERQKKEGLECSLRDSGCSNKRYYRRSQNLCSLLGRFRDLCLHA